MNSGDIQLDLRFSYAEILSKKNIRVRASVAPTSEESASAPLPVSHFISFHQRNKLFISFTYSSVTTPQLGWKAHIGVDDSDRNGRVMGSDGNEILYSENLEKAWNIVKNIAIKYRILSLKVIKPEKTLIKNPQQCGKQITIYCVFQMDLAWETIFTEIENELVKNNVKPAPLSPGDKPLLGSAYISYRNDDSGEKDEHGVSQYIVGAYNQSGAVDIFAGYNIQLESNLVSPVRPIFDRENDSSRPGSPLGSSDANQLLPEEPQRVLAPAPVEDPGRMCCNVT